MRKRFHLLALLLAVMMAFCSCEALSFLPFGGEGSAESEDTTDGATQSTEDSTESSAPATTEKPDQPSEPVVKVKTVKIFNAGQLMTVLESSKAADYAETSKNTVYQLQCDIDLNEGWSAEMTENGKLPNAPTNVWTGIEKFYGTLDGNGHAIKGIYMFKTIEGECSMGLIGELCGGTVKNLTIENALIAADVADEAQNVYVGGLIGEVNEASTVENVAVNATVYVGGHEGVVISGTVAKKAENALTETNFTFGGEIIHVAEDPSIVKVSTAEELLVALAEHGDFAEKTLKLTADIDLNPGWNASVTIGDTVVFPEAPAVIWTPIANFKGIFDGNGHILSGLYVNHTVVGNQGAFGGLFNTLDGGTVKNLAITNSFILASNSGWGSKNIHVGGIAGDVNEGSAVYTVYMDAGVWFKSAEQCVLGGAFGFANGAYTVNGFVFVGTIGNTNDSLEANYATASGKNICIATVTACQNWKGGSVTNSLGLKEGIYTGRNYLTNTDRIGTDLPNSGFTQKCIANTRESAEWLLTRPDDYGIYFTWSDALQSIIPLEAVDLVNYVFAKS